MDLLQPESPRRTRRKPIGIGLYGEGSLYTDDPVEQESLDPAIRDEMLDNLSQSSGQGISAALQAIDTPRAYFQGWLAGKPGERVSGEELLDTYGLLPSEHAMGGWGRPLAGFAAEALGDPLNIFTLGGSALSKAGRAAKAAGMLDDATRVASRELLSSGGELGAFGRNAARSWQDNFGKGLADLTDADLAARPLVGRRMAQRSLTLEDLIDAQPNRADAIQKIENWAGAGQYNNLRGRRLGGDIGIGLPFRSPAITGNIPVLGEYLSGGLDRLGQMARWSGPGRFATSLFDNSVAGNTEEGGQILAKQVSAARQQGEEAGRRIAADALQKLPENAFTPDTQQLLRRVLAGPNVASASDMQFVARRPELQEFVDRWKSMAPDYIQRSKAAGIGSAELKDPFGTDYFPRHANKNLFPGMKSGPGKGNLDFSTLTGDQLARADELKMPGGEATLQRLSLDPNVAGFNRTAANDLEAAKYIKAEADKEIRRIFPTGATPTGGPVPTYSMQQAMEAARTLHRIDPEAIKKGFPLFGSSVGEDLTRYVTGRERSIRVANTLYDAIASSAVPQNYGTISTQVPGGGYRSYTTAAEALQKLGLQSTPDAAGNLEGAAKQLLDRLEKRFGPGAISDLSNVTIDERLLERLTRISDFYASPEAQGKLMTFLDDLTRMFKANILAWPARFVRDWYSSIVSNFYEVRNPMDLRKGYQGAKYLIQGQYERLDPILRSISRYQSLGDATARRQAFLSDLAASQILTGRGLADVGDELVSDMAGTGLMSELVPGSTPRTTLGYQVGDLLSGRMPLSSSRASYAELLNAGNWATAARKLPGQLDPRNLSTTLADKDVVNPVLRWSNKLGDTTDAINRAAGYIALLRQGLDPMEAARRIKASQVDYNSLTKFERNFLRRIFPWYSYNSRILKYVGSEIYNNPGGMYVQFGMRMPERMQQNDEEQYVPQAIREKLGVNLNRLAGNSPLLQSAVSMLTPNRPDATPFLVDIDLPGADAINYFSPRFDPETGMMSPWLTAKETGKSILAQTHPLAKAAFQLMTDQDLATKRDLSAMATTPQIMLRAAGLADKGDPLDRRANQISPLLDLIPFMPRVGQTVRRLADSERIPDFSTRLAQTLFNTFTGMKVQNVTDEARTQDARAKIEELLAPYSRSFEQRYIPKEQIPFLDPEVARLYLLDRALNREQKQRVRDRKKEQESSLLY